MRVDESFGVEMVASKGGHGFEFSVKARRSMQVDPIALRLFEVDFAELADILGLDATTRTAFDDRAARLVFSNGWQSWSFAGELGMSERVRPAIVIEALNTYVYRPGPREGKKEILSHFFTRIRIGEQRIVLVSLGPGVAAGGARIAGAPLAFRVDRKSLATAVEIQARGASFREGEVVATIAFAYLEGFFAERDFFRAHFADPGRFARLAFLGAPGEGEETPVPGGYESWYNHYTEIDEAIIRSDLAAIASNDNLINTYYIRRGKPTVFQIDDGWESAIGDWSPDAGKFPGGMATLARDIEAEGLIPGLWIAPFIVERGSRAAIEHPDWLLRDARGRPVVAGWNNHWTGDFHAWDLSLPEVGDWLDSIFATIVDDWGYRYLKLDFLYAGLLEGMRQGGGAAWEQYERVVSRLASRAKNAKGLPLAWLGCGAPLESSYAHFPLMRIGADTKEVWDDFQARLVRHQGRPAARINLLHTIGRSILDTAVFVNDPDVVFCRTKGMGYGEKEKELIAVVARIFASQIMFSDDTGGIVDPQDLAFTKRIVALYDRLAEFEFGASRVRGDLFKIVERAGKILGWVNLGDRVARLDDYEAGLYRPDPLLPNHVRNSGGEWFVEGRSVTLLALQ